MTATPKPFRPIPALIRTLLLQPVFAIPFGIFFGTVLGQGWSAYAGAYIVSLVFAYTIGLSLWALRTFVIPRLPDAEWQPGKSGFWTHGLLYGGTSLLASFAGAAIVHFTLIPGFLGGARQLTILGFYSLLFVVLFSAISYSVTFYRHAIMRAKDEQELHLARRIQRSFLISQFPEMRRLEVHAVNVSSKEVSGDFYDVVPAGEGAFLIAIADVAGKGVPAALLTSMLQASLRTQANITPSVSQMTHNMNTLAYRSTAVHQFATVFLARVDEQTLRLAYTNAGHNPPTVYHADGKRTPLVCGGTVVGILEDARYEEDGIALAGGDRVVLYTDGISEATNAQGELFGEDRLHALIESLPRDLAARAVVDRILEGVHAFLGETEPQDDMTLMVLRVM